MDRPPSPEKRSRTTRNPLRRGPSSRNNMQMLDSPQTSSQDLTTTQSRQEAPRIQTTTLFTDRPQTPPEQPLEQRRSDDQPNGEHMQSTPKRISSLPAPNGVQMNRDLGTVQEGHPTPQVPTLVQRDAEGYSMPSSAVDDITRAQQEAALSG